MSGVVFRETLRRNWLAGVLLGITLAVLAVYIVAIFGDSTTLKQYSEMIKNMGWAVQLFGGGDAVFIATPAGMLNYGYFTWTMLLLAGYAIVVGLNVTANEEERGIMDVLLSAPIPRWRLILEKLLAQGVVLGIALTIGHTGLTIAVSQTPTFDVSAARLLESTLNMLPTLLLVLISTVLLATVVRRRNTAAAIAAAFVFGSYLVDVIGRTAQSANFLSSISFFKYYDSIAVMKDGMVWSNWLGLLALALAFGLLAMWRFQRRDIGL